MLRPFKPVWAVFFVLPLWVSGTVLSRAEEAAPTKNGLFPDEILTAEQLKQKMDANESFLLLDARDKKSFDSDHIQGAALPRGEEYYRQQELFAGGMTPAAPDADAALAEQMKSVPKDGLIVTYCNSNCHASSALALILKQSGFTNVRSMEEGIQSWEKKGYPVVKKQA